MRHITVIDGHPDPVESHLNHALADRYAESAVAAGCEVRRIDVARLDFPMLRRPADFYEGTPPQSILDAQADIAWADHLTFFYPLWMGDVPALLKAFLEQTLRPGFAMEYAGGLGFPKQLLKGKSARIVVTMGMPTAVYRTLFGAFTLKNLERMFGMVGIAPVEETLFGRAGEACEPRYRKWLKQIAMLAERDAAGRPGRRVRPLRTLARMGLVAAGAYAAYTALTWSRYGTNGRSAASGDTLLARAMPDYEARVHHGTSVAAPASVTFNAIRASGFERFSPLVQAMFRARELLLGAEHVELSLPSGLLEQLAALGWSVISEEPGREIVLGTVTQPWQPNPVFHGLASSEFERFGEPGYAKIAFSLRVTPRSPESCEMYTETRVSTTDPVSRARFRRYWALLSPGIALIRILLLAQVKADAEARYKSELTYAGT